MDHDAAREGASHSIMRKDLVKIGRVFSEICLRTDTQTHSQTRSSRYSAPYWEWSKVFNIDRKTRTASIWVQDGRLGTDPICETPGAKDIFKIYCRLICRQFACHSLSIFVWGTLDLSQFLSPSYITMHACCFALRPYRLDAEDILGWSSWVM